MEDLWVSTTLVIFVETALCEAFAMANVFNLRNIYFPCLALNVTNSFSLLLWEDYFIVSILIRDLYYLLFTW